MSRADAQHDVYGHLAAFYDLMRGGYLFELMPSPRFRLINHLGCIPFLYFGPHLAC